MSGSPKMMARADQPNADVADGAQKHTRPVVDEINKDVNDALSQADVKDKLANFGFELSPGPAQQVSDLMKNDRAHYAEVVKRVKLSID